MSSAASNLPGPVNHVFVDFENVQDIELEIIGRETVSFTLLVGAAQKKLDAALVEKLFRHAASVHLVRLTSSGRNALDFTLSYYVGRAVAADPTGYFHVVSKDTGFDPLIEHLRSRHVRVRRHDSFATLTVASPAKPQTPTPPAPHKPKPEAKPKIQPPLSAAEQEARVVEHLRKLGSKRPRSQTKLVSYLVAHLGHKITPPEALKLVEDLGQAGHLFVDEKGKVTYHLEST